MRDVDGDFCSVTAQRRQLKIVDDCSRSCWLLLLLKGRLLALMDHEIEGSNRYKTCNDVFFVCGLRRAALPAAFDLDRCDGIRRLIPITEESHMVEEENRTISSFQSSPHAGRTHRHATSIMAHKILPLSA